MVPRLQIAHPRRISRSMRRLAGARTSSSPVLLVPPLRAHGTGTSFPPSHARGSVRSRSPIALTLSPSFGTFFLLSIFPSDIYCFSAHIVHWLTEANRPFKIMEDRELRELLLAGCPELTVPSRRTIGHDLNAAFNRCSQRIVRMLEVRLLSSPLDMY